MDTNADYRDRYERMSDDELVYVAKDREHLVKEASALLDAELENRGLNPNSGDAGRYEAQWRDYTRRRNLFIFGCLSVVPLFVVSAIISLRLFNTLIPASALAVLWLIFFLVAGANLNKFQCPRCGNLFSATKFYNKSVSARRCVHCGLPKP